jgi:hypothetical protein
MTASQKYTQAQQETAFANVTPKDEIVLHRETGLTINTLDTYATVSLAFAAYLLDSSEDRSFDKYLSMGVTDLASLFEADPDASPKAPDSESETTGS